MKLKIKKKIVLISSLLILLIGSLLSVSYAIYKSQLEVSNEFKTGKVDVDITENFNDDWGMKEVFITNNSSNSSVVLRVYFTEKWMDDNGDNTNNLTNSQNRVEKGWTEEFSGLFIYATDGWYYYKKIIEPSESVQIMSTISSDDESTEDYELTFHYEAVQATEDAILDVWGLEASINDKDVSWSF